MNNDGLISPQSILDQVLHGATEERIVIVNERSHADVRFANNTATTNGMRRDRKVTVISIDRRPGGAAIGIASASGMPDLNELVQSARSKALEAPLAEDAAGLVEAREIGALDELAEETDLGVFSNVLEDLAGAFDSAKSAGHRLYGFGEHQIETTYLATSTGLRARHVQPTGSFELVARDEQGERSTWTARGTADFSGIDVNAMHAHLTQRLTWASRHVSLPAGRYEVLMPPDAVADLVIELWGAMSGRNAEDGGNVFSKPGGATRVGERLSDLAFNLFSDPHAKGLSCAPFLETTNSGSDTSVFDNGVLLEAEHYINNGTLERLRYHRAGAVASNKPFAAPIDNLILELPGASTSLEEMIASSERALLLTCLWYIREVDPATLLLTGLTRDGVYLVEHGEVVGAVNNFRFNESPLDLLAKSIEVGVSERALSREWGEWFNRTAMPSLRVLDFNMSSVSEAR